MSADGPDAADGLANARALGPEDGEASSPSDALADTEAGFAPRPSSADALRDAAERASVKAKLFGSPRAADAAMVGRYAILKVLGEGGMGTVYACFDDQLDRRVALKLLKGPESEDARKRMLREAQAMAKLSHPNVVPVFEVGEHEGQLFVAMEYVRGQTLARWQSEEERDWKDVLEKYLQAGRGLEAAHAEGLVHRDFKPHNAVVGTEGRVRVLDFGLAAKHGDKAVTQTHSTIIPRAKDAALDTPLTETGTVMGTPAYMPPEQFMSGTVDARSDQFSFCVALWEGLYGLRPFEGKTTAELFTKVAQGKFTESPRRHVPAVIRTALERGLKSTADERWPDMATLLRELEATSSRGRRRTIGIVALLGVSLVLALVYVVARSRHNAAQQIHASEQRAEEADATAEQATALAVEKTAMADRAEFDRAAAERGQRNALLVSTAGGVANSPSEGAALLREVIGADPHQVFGWSEGAASVRAGRRSLRASLEGHTGLVRSARFSPDGTRVATASTDATARVWNTDGTGTALVLEGHTAALTGLEFSPDGTRIVTASWDNTARVWSVDSPDEVTVLGGHPSAVRWAGFSPDGARVLTVSGGGVAQANVTVRMEAADGSGEATMLEGIRGRFILAHFGASVPIIVTAGEDNTVQLWNPNRAGEPVVLEGHTAPVTWANFSPDGTRIVTTSEDMTARVWNPDGTGEPVVLKGHTDFISGASFSPDGARIVTASSDRTARVWNADGTGEVMVLRGAADRLYSPSFSPDGTRVLAASTDRVAWVWNADGTGDAVALEGHAIVILWAEFSPDGTHIVTASQDKTARVWSAHDVGEPLILEGHASEATSAGFSVDGTRIVSGSEDRTTRVWDVDRIGAPTVINGEAGVIGTDFSPDGRMIVTSSRDMVARIWNADGTGKPKTLEGHSGAVYSANYSPDGRRIVTASADKTARVWDADGTGESAVLEGHGKTVASARFSPDGTRIVTGSLDGTARVWDAESTTELVSLEGHTGAVTCASFSPDGTRIVTSSMDGTARVWGAAGKGEPTVLEGHTDQVYSADFSPDGAWIVTASLDRTVRVWNVDTPRKSTVLRGHTAGVTSASFSPDGQRIVSSSKDNSIRVWSLAEALKAARTVFWQTPFCHSARRRHQLLGEPQSLARINRERCLRLTALCSTQRYDTCDAAITEAFAVESAGG